MTKDQKAQIEKSISSFGQADPIIINHDGTIIGGHQRYLIFKAHKAITIECMEANEQLSPTQVDELTVRLNKNTGEFDYDLLANGYNLEDLLDFGFTREDLELDPPEEKPTPWSMTFKSEDPAERDAFEDRVQEILVEFDSISYKIRGG